MKGRMKKSRNKDIFFNEECKEKRRMEGGGGEERELKKIKKWNFLWFHMIPNVRDKQIFIWLSEYVTSINTHSVCTSVCVSGTVWVEELGIVINRGLNPAHTAKQTNSCIQPPLCNTHTHTHTHTIWSVLTKTKRKHDSDITPPHTPCPRIPAF